MRLIYPRAEVDRVVDLCTDRRDYRFLARFIDMGEGGLEYVNTPLLAEGDQWHGMLGDIRPHNLRLKGGREVVVAGYVRGKHDGSIHPSNAGWVVERTAEMRCARNQNLGQMVGGPEYIKRRAEILRDFFDRSTNRPFKYAILRRDLRTMENKFAEANLVEINGLWFYVTDFFGNEDDIMLGIGDTTDFLKMKSDLSCRGVVVSDCVLYGKAKRNAVGSRHRRSAFEVISMKYNADGKFERVELES